MPKRFNLAHTQAKIVQRSNKTNQSTLVLKLSNESVFKIKFDDQQKFFKVDDLVQVVYDSQKKHVYAILNHKIKLLYLEPNLVNDHSKGSRHSFSRFIYIFSSCFIFILFMIITHQLISDWDVFWGDIQDGLVLMLIANVGIGLAIFTLTEKKDQSVLLEEVLGKFNFPHITAVELRHFVHTNSYFELNPCFFDVRLLMNLDQQKSKHEIDTGLRQVLTHKNQFGLVKTEVERFKLIKYEGKLSALHIEKVPYSSEHTDPFSLVKFKFDQIRLYGYMDEFHLKNNTSVTVICSNFSDQHGHYIWALSDQHRYVYLDEDMLVDLVYQLNDQLSSYRYSIMFGLILISTISFLWAFLFLSEDGFIDQFIFAFLHLLSFILVLKPIICVYNSLFLKNSYHQHQQNINRYVASQLKTMLMLPNQTKISDLGKYRIERSFENGLSRTGFDLKPD